MLEGDMPPIFEHMTSTTGTDLIGFGIRISDEPQAHERGGRIDL